MLKKNGDFERKHTSMQWPRVRMKSLKQRHENRWNQYEWDWDSVYIHIGKQSKPLLYPKKAGHRARNKEMWDFEVSGARGSRPQP